jgi:hypothetical protein
MPDETITCVITYDRVLWRRAMTGWWQSVVPPAPFLKRAIFWAIVWFAIGALTLGLSAAGIGPGFVFAGLVGAAFLIGVFGYLQRTRMSQFWDVVGAHWDKAGVTQASFGPGGIVLKDDVSTKQLSWAAIDAVKPKQGLTVIRSGISMTVIPDAILPDDLTGKAFRAQIAIWRTA